MIKPLKTAPYLPPAADDMDYSIDQDTYNGRDTDNHRPIWGNNIGKNQIQVACAYHDESDH